MPQLHHSEPEITLNQPYSKKIKNTSQVTLEKPSPVLTGPALFLKATALALAMAFALLLITALGVAIWGYGKAVVFKTHSGLEFSQIRDLAETALTVSAKQSNNTTTILLLGLDSLQTRPGSPQLTDTMMLVSIHYPTGSISMLPLPRDIWNQEYQTKINALYHYGKERYPEQPERFPTEVLFAMTGVPIEYTVIVTMDQVGTLIDMLGGIEVAVPVGFTDKEFPRPDVDVTVERDPAVLYQTVTFEQGEQTLSGERALQYIRSRKSGDEQGDDTARSERQQQVITALSSKIMSRELLTNPEILGKLTRYYQETFEQYLPLTQAAAVVRQLVPQRQNISITSHSLPISPTDPEGVISNPPLRKYSLWVYEVVSPQVFSDYVQKKLLH